MPTFEETWNMCWAVTSQCWSTNSSNTRKFRRLSEMLPERNRVIAVRTVKSSIWTC